MAAHPLESVALAGLASNGGVEGEAVARDGEGLGFRALGNTIVGSCKVLVLRPAKGPTTIR